MKRRGSTVRQLKHSPVKIICLVGHLHYVN